MAYMFQSISEPETSLCQMLVKSYAILLVCLERNMFSSPHLEIRAWCWPGFRDSAVKGLDI